MNRSVLARRVAALAVACYFFAAPPPPAAAARRASPPACCVDSVLCATPSWTVAGDQADGRLGSVAPAGDVDGDGFDDLLVGSYNRDHPEVDEGVVFLFRGGPNGLSTLPSWSTESNQPGARLGDKLSGCGDVNGDGYDDVIVGAGFYDSLATDAGAAFLYLGSASGLGSEAAWIAVGDQADAQFGACVQGAGDVNGDGYADVVVGAWLHDHGEINEGRAFVYLGSDSGLASTPAWVGESNSVNAVYGYFCGPAGDVNGDGFDDVVVGARRFSGNGLIEEGRIYVYHGSPTGLSPVASWIRDGGREKSELGASVISAGDVNGDGYGDLVAGAFRYDNPDLDEGKAWVFLGSATGLSSTPSWENEGDVPRNNFGYQVSAAGDVDADGYDDVIVSAPGVDVDDFTWYNAGQVTLYRGSAAGLSPAPEWRQDGDQDYMALESVRGVGDVNGDGADDVATGSLYRDGDAVDAGQAWVFHGCSRAWTHVPPAHASRLAFAARPNPFAGSSTLAFELPRPGPVRVTIHDAQGRTVAIPIARRLEAGRHTVVWPGPPATGDDVAPGLYFARLRAGRAIATLKLLRLP